MVHALEQIRRVLQPAGHLMDLRPLAARWPVEVSWKDAKKTVGRMIDLPTGLADDAAANAAMSAASRRGWFRLKSRQFFPLYLYWDDPEEMNAHVLEKWADFITLGDDTLQAARAAWALPGEQKRMRIKARMMLSLWAKK